MSIADSYELRSPTTPVEWTAYHAIRRRVLFELRGQGHAYDVNHPDERRGNNHPKVLVHAEDIVGVIRIDLQPPRAVFRRVAVREDAQRRGHGTALLRLAESFAREHGCTEVMSFVDPDATMFYAKSGYRIAEGDRQGSSVPMTKALSLGAGTAGAA